MNNNVDLHTNIYINKNFLIDECMYKKDEKVVIFSPFTLETLLCDISVLDLLAKFKQIGDNPLALKFTENDQESMREAIQKLIEMRILQAKE